MTGLEIVLLPIAWVMVVKKVLDLLPNGRRCRHCGDSLGELRGRSCVTCHEVRIYRSKRGRFKDEESYQKVLRWLSTSRRIQARE